MSVQVQERAAVQPPRISPLKATLGAPLSAFINEFGPYLVAGKDHSSSGRFRFADVVRKLEVVCLVDNFNRPAEQSLVVCVIITGPDNAELNVLDKDASKMMERFHPGDSRWQKDKVTAHGQSGWFIGFDRVYLSDWLSHQFPPEYFKNREGRTIISGTFDLQCLYHMETKNVKSATLAIGAMMLDDVRPGEAG